MEELATPRATPLSSGKSRPVATEADRFCGVSAPLDAPHDGIGDRLTTRLSAYRAFLEAKRPATPTAGDSAILTLGRGINPLCKPHQAAIIRWAVEGGRRAIFAKFGLGKTVMQLEALRLVLSREGGKALIIAPLGVRQEFLRDAGMLGLTVAFVRTTAEMDAPGLYLTNYESVRERKIDVRAVEQLTAVSLDEASILRGFGGTKTFREFMATLAGDDRSFQRDETSNSLATRRVRTNGIPFRFVATATPSPNEYIELLSYAAFLGIMDVGEAKTRFFKRDSEHADKLTLYPHKEEEFWLWVNTWAVFLQSPADLGFPADGYELPSINVRWHAVSAGDDHGGYEKNGQAKLMRDAAIGIQDAAHVKRSTLAARVAKVRELVEASPDEHVILWHDLEDERRALEAKWKRHDAMMAQMTDIIRRYGLNATQLHEKLKRSIGVTRQEARGESFLAVNNDAVEETMAMPEASVGLVVTSIPFGTQYEYTPSYNDFGHTDDDAHFFRQMDFLSPELLRVLQPGRVLCVHVKDRVRPGGLDGLGFQTVSPFHAHAILHYQRHGFVYMGMITVVTDVVRENAQTYRLGWSMQCDDGSRMSVGMPEYILLFRKPPSDNTDGYADTPVAKSKDEYTRGRWQTDAHAFWRSNGNRVMVPEDLVGLDANDIFQRFRGWTFATVYDYERAVAVADVLDQAKRLPPGFQLLQPASWHPDVWTDVARMRTLNGTQQASGREMHLCPLQFDIVDRLITRFSNAGDVVYDPFAGLFTVPLEAVKLGRRGLGVELSSAYFADGVRYLRSAEEQASVPTLFDLLDGENSAEVPDKSPTRTGENPGNAAVSVAVAEGAR